MVVKLHILYAIGTLVMIAPFVVSFFFARSGNLALAEVAAGYGYIVLIAGLVSLVAVPAIIRKSPFKDRFAWLR